MAKQFAVALSERFKRELQSQIAWLFERNERAADAAEKRVRVALRRLARFPELGRPGRVGSTRELSVPRTRYIIAYRVEGNRVEIIALRHAKQDWPQKF